MGTERPGEPLPHLIPQFRGIGRQYRFLRLGHGAAPYRVPVNVGLVTLRQSRAIGTRGHRRAPPKGAAVESRGLCDVLCVRQAPCLSEVAANGTTYVAKVRAH
jgi:hypothetical protein